MCTAAATIFAASRTKEGENLDLSREGLSAHAKTTDMADFLCLSCTACKSLHKDLPGLLLILSRTSLLTVAPVIVGCDNRLTCVLEGLAHTDKNRL
jgi:hypothetical protein